MALNPRYGEHCRDEGQDSACAVKEFERTVAIVLAKNHKQVAIVSCKVDEMVEVPERIDNDVQASHAQKANQEHLDKLAKEIPVDGFSHDRLQWM